MEIGSYFSNLQGLPVSPSILPSLIQALVNPDVTVEDVEKKLRLDMSMSAQVIRLSNSSYFSFGKPTSDLNEAIARIGMEETYRLVSSLAAVEFVKLAHDASGVDPERVWAASIRSAVAMELIADACGRNPIDAYSIGLFHNIGIVVINQMIGSQYDEVVMKADQEGVAVRDAEVEVLGFNYIAVSSMLLEYWKFSKSISQPIYFQFDPKNCADYPELAAMLHLTLHLLADMDIIDKDYALTEESLEACKESLGMDDEFVAGLTQKIQGGAERVEEIING